MMMIMMKVDVKLIRLLVKARTDLHSRKDGFAFKHNSTASVSGSRVMLAVSNVNVTNANSIVTAAVCTYVHHSVTLSVSVYVSVCLCCCC